MGRDSGGDTEDGTKLTDLGDGYQLQWTMMIGYRILKDGQPVTQFWATEWEVATWVIIPLLKATGAGA